MRETRRLPPRATEPRYVVHATANRERERERERRRRANSRSGSFYTRLSAFLSSSFPVSPALALALVLALALARIAASYVPFRASFSLAPVNQTTCPTPRISFPRRGDVITIRLISTIRWLATLPPPPSSRASAGFAGPMTSSNERTHGNIHHICIVARAKNYTRSFDEFPFPVKILARERKSRARFPLSRETS